MMARAAGVIAFSMVGFTLLLLSAPSMVRAEPFLAVREGFHCNQCHVNRMGGGMRNEFGLVFSQVALPTMRLGDLEERLTVPSFFIDTHLSPHVRIGGDLRHNDTTTFEERSKYQGELTSEIQTQTSPNLPTGNIYLEMKLLGDYLLFYVDETMAPEVVNREAFALAQNLPGGTFVKIGKFFQPFGFRLVDDETSIRRVTQFRFDTPQLGVEVGIDNRPIHAAIAVTKGRDGTVDRKVTGTAVAVFRNFRLGGSYSYIDQSTETRPSFKNVGGLLGGLSLGRLTTFGELDLVRTTEEGEDQKKLAGFVEVDFLALRGINLKVAYDYFDPDMDVEENHKSRAVFGIEAFPIPFLQVSLYYQLRLDIPQAPAVDKADRLIFQVAHVFL